MENFCKINHKCEGKVRNLLIQNALTHNTDVVSSMKASEVCHSCECHLRWNKTFIPSSRHNVKSRLYVLKSIGINWHAVLMDT